MKDRKPLDNLNKKVTLCWKRILAGACILCLCFAIYCALAISVYAKVDEKRPCNALIVLGAGTKDGTPSPVFAARIDHALWLYENGYADKIIFTGGIGKGQTLSDAAVAKNYAVGKGVHEDDILLEEKSKITQQNIENASEIVRDNHFDTVIIVSDPLHMKRAMCMARDYGLKAYSSPTPTTRYISFRSNAGFLAREVFFYMGYLVFKIF